jgi:hypothetical protein
MTAEPGTRAGKMQGLMRFFWFFVVAFGIGKGVV